MLGDAWDLHRIVKWTNFQVWDPNMEIDPEVRSEIGECLRDLFKTFDGILKAHIKAYGLGLAKSQIRVCFL